MFYIFQNNGVDNDWLIILQVLVLASAFCMVMAIYETLEYMFCYDDEKKKHYDEMQAAVQQRQRSENNPGRSAETDNSDSYNNGTGADPASNSEGTRLLDGEDIPLTSVTNGGHVPSYDNGGPYNPHPPTHTVVTGTAPSDDVFEEKPPSTFLQSLKNYFKRRPFHYKILSGDSVKEDTDRASSGELNDSGDNLSTARETDALISNKRTSVDEDVRLVDESSSALVNSNRKYVTESDSSILQGDDVLSHEFNFTTALSTNPLSTGRQQNGPSLTLNWWRRQVLILPS